MEFSEKLQELRKRRGMTQEELAEALYVSRTAVSKWESGRGYPSIDSLKQISAFFSVSIDDLLSGEKLISIAEQENRSNIRYVCDMLFGMTDLLSFLAVVLPLYPKAVNGFVYSVNLFDYTALTQLSRLVYWLLLSALVLTGALKVFLTLRQNERGQKTVTGCSVVIGILSVIVLSLAGETYAVTMVFLLLLIKVGLLYRCIKSD